MLRRGPLQKLIAMVGALGATGEPKRPPIPHPLQNLPQRIIVSFTRFDRRRAYVKLDCGHEILVDWPRERPDLKPGVDRGLCTKCPTK